MPKSMQFQLSPELSTAIKVHKANTGVEHSQLAEEGIRYMLGMGWRTDEPEDVTRIIMKVGQYVFTGMRVGNVYRSEDDTDTFDKIDGWMPLPPIWGGCN